MKVGHDIWILLTWIKYTKYTKITSLHEMLHISSTKILCSNHIPNFKFAAKDQ